MRNSIGYSDNVTPTVLFYGHTWHTQQGTNINQLCHSKRQSDCPSDITRRRLLLKQETGDVKQR